MANSYFAYGSHRFDVITQSLSYSQVMTMTSSQARTTQTSYPQKWSQKFVNIKMIFPNVDEHLRFGSFLRDYFYAALSQNDYLVMRFVCDKINADLNIVPEKAPISVDITSVAPSMTVKCAVINNNKTERPKVLKSGKVITDRLFLENTAVDATTEYDRFFIGTDNERAMRVTRLIDLGNLVCKISQENFADIVYSGYCQVVPYRSAYAVVLLEGGIEWNIPVSLEWILQHQLYDVSQMTWVHQWGSWLDRPSEYMVEV